MRRNHRRSCAAALAALAALTVCGAARADAPRYRLTVVADPAANDTIAMGVNRAGSSVGYLVDFDQTAVTSRAFVASADGVITRLELPTDDDSYAQVVNDYGVVAGTYEIIEGSLGIERLFRWTANAGVVELGTLGGGHGEVFDINNAGVIVGYWQDSAGMYRAFRYSDATGWQQLYPDATKTAWAIDINERGEIVGNVWTSSLVQQAWHWRDGVRTDFAGLGGGFTHVYYINNQGVAVGQAEIADGSWRAFRWTQEQGMAALPMLPGAVESQAFWITDAGVIGGTQRFDVEEADGRIRRKYHAFLFDDTQGLVDLGVDVGTNWRAPVSMNLAGEAVFSTMDPNAYELHPYVYAPDSGLHELNSLIEGDWPFAVDEPVGINACGEISAISWAAFGTSPTQSISVLLSPIRAGDFDGDSDVDLADYARLQVNFGTPTGAAAEQGDLDGDGDVDAADAQAFIAAWRSPCR